MWLTIDQLGVVANEIGFGAVQLTVRPGGHVEPDRVERGLPRALRTLTLAAAHALRADLDYIRRRTP